MEAQSTVPTFFPKASAVSIGVGKPSRRVGISICADSEPRAPEPPKDTLLPQQGCGDVLREGCYILLPRVHAEPAETQHCAGVCCQPGAERCGIPAAERRHGSRSGGRGIQGGSWIPCLGQVPRRCPGRGSLEQMSSPSSIASQIVTVLSLPRQWQFERYQVASVR